MTSPVPGVTYPNPRTWAIGDYLTTPRLRGDMANLAAIYSAGARPMILSLNNTGPTPTSGTATNIGIGSVAALNSWNANLTPPGFGGSAFLIPLAGFWLLQSDVTFTLGAAAGNSKYASGFLTATNNTVNANVDGGALPASTTTGQICGVANCDLYQFNAAVNTNNGDFVQTYVYTNNSNVGTVLNAFYMFEWVGLPQSGLTNYGGPYGTTATPVAASAWPAGPGTTLTGPCQAGATTIVVADATGMVTGGILGLDFLNGQMYTPYAETVTISSVAGTTIGISATTYAHGSFLTGVNSNFEGSLGTWVPDNNCTITDFTGGSPHSGGSTLQMTSLAAGDMQAASCTAASYAVNALPCSPGDTIAGAVFFRAQSSTRTCQAGVAYYTAAGVHIGADNYGTGVTDSTSAWTQAFVSGAAPATAAWAIFIPVVKSTGAANEIHYMDDAIFGNATAAPGPVAVPVSAAFMNQQVRDQIRYLAYPPLCKAAPGSTQSIPSQSFPAGTQIGLNAVIDTWSGFSGNQYTVPHSGIYLVYGQVYYAGVGGTSFTFSAGIQQNSGTIQWGVRARSNTSTSQTFCATVRRMIRCTAGDTIRLYGFQDSGSAMSTALTINTFSRLIAVWRSF